MIGMIIYQEALHCRLGIRECMRYTGTKTKEEWNGSLSILSNLEYPLQQAESSSMKRSVHSSIHIELGLFIGDSGADVCFVLDCHSAWILRLAKLFQPGQSAQTTSSQRVQEEFNAQYHFRKSKATTCRYATFCVIRSDAATTA